MELNNRYLNNFGRLTETQHGYRIMDNRGNTILNLADDYIRNGDLVVLLRGQEEDRILKLNSEFRVDMVVRSKFLQELSNIIPDAQVVAIGYYIRKPDGTMSVSGTTIH